MKQSQRRELALFSRAGNPAASLVTHCHHTVCCRFAPPAIGFVFPGGQPRRIARNSLSPHRLLPIRPAGNWLCSAHFALRPGEIGFVWRIWPHARPRPAPSNPQSAIEELALFRTIAHPESTAWGPPTASVVGPGRFPGVRSTPLCRWLQSDKLPPRRGGIFAGADLQGGFSTHA
jgi:hypothetical protein